MSQSFEPIQSENSESVSTINLTLTDSELLPLMRSQALRRAKRSLFLRDRAARLQSMLNKVISSYGNCEKKLIAKIREFEDLSKRYGIIYKKNTELIKELKEERIQPKQRMCVICLDAEINVVFEPCKHAVCCLECADKLAKRARSKPLLCPFCKTTVTSSAKIYFG